MMERFGGYFHALELNGLRPWSENRKVAWLARESGHPPISGGDRHGCDGNSIVNLTNAATFAEFVGEVRRDRHSTVLFLPQHPEPLRYRVVQAMWDIMRTYPGHLKDRQIWNDRVFYRDDAGVARPVSSCWSGATSPPS